MGPASTEGECPLCNIFIASDRGSNPPHSGIFSHGNLLSIMRDLKSKKSGRVSQPRNLAEIGKAVAANLLCVKGNVA